MAGFDISTAKPAKDKSVSGFDISTAKPDEQGFFEKNAPAIKSGINLALRSTGLPELSAIETAATVGSGIVAEPLAGLTGLVSLPFTSPEQASENIETVRNALTFIPQTEEGMATLQKVANVLEPVGEAVTAAEEGIGDFGYEQTGSPAVGAIGQTIPTAALEATGLGAVRRASKAAKTAAKVTKKKIPAEKTYEQIAKDLKTKRTKKVTEQIKPDKEILAAADDLGIVLNPSAYSNNILYRQIEQALKDTPGSKLLQVEEKSILNLGESAEKLVRELGGETDRSMLDLDLRNQIIGKIKDLESKANNAYDAVKIPKQTLITPKATIKYLDDVVADLGGDTSLLSSAEKKLLSLTQYGKTPTYAALDRVRKDIGRAFKNRGVFKEDADANLNSVYKALSIDQNNIASAFGFGDEYLLANKLFSTKKSIEKQAKKLIGKELDKSIIPQISLASKSLPKGDVSRFKKLMNSIPENRRQEVSATMLDDLFSYGARTNKSIGQGFVNAYKGLNKNKAAKDILFKNLPPGSMQRFDKIGKVAEGIYRAKSLENKSRTAASVIAALDSGGLIKKMYDGAKVIPGTRTIGTVSDAFVNKVTPATKVSDDFITSAGFRKAIDAQISGDTKRANKILKGYPKYKKWLSQQTPNVKKQIAAVGFIQYLTGEK